MALLIAEGGRDRFAGGETLMRLAMISVDGAGVGGEVGCGIADLMDICPLRNQWIVNKSQSINVYM